MAERVRIGLVGGGPWARRVHAPALAAHQAVEFAGVWARRPAIAAEIAGAQGTTAFAGFDELVGAVDAVAFAVPPGVQAKLARVAAAAGRHVILEKPIAADIDGAVRLAGDVREAGVASVVMLTLRFGAETKAWLAEVTGLDGWHGGLARWLSGALLGGYYRDSAWRHHQGALADIGPHAIDLMDAALGPVTAVVAAHRAEPDLWHLVLDHEGGASSTVTMSLKVPVDPSIVDVDVYGERGRVALQPRQTSALDSYAAMLDEFVSMVGRGETTHPCDVTRGLHLQRIIDAAYARAGFTADTVAPG